MKIFLTGATGFLGRRLLNRLLGDGHEVTCLVRDAEAADQIAALGCRVVEGSLENVGNWIKWLRGQEIVIHAAGPVEVWGPWKKFEKQIVEATEAIYRAASREGVRRFIYISSESVVQNKRTLLDIDETFQYLKPDSNYGKAKQLAEKRLLAGVSETECIILRPTFIWGKGMPMLKELIDTIDTGKFTWVGNGNTVIEWVHVENVVNAIICALERGEDKGIYFVTDENPKPVREIFNQLLATQHITASRRNTSSFLVKLAANLAEFWWKLFRLKSRPPITHFEWSFVALPRRYNINKAKTDLGYHPVISEKMGLAEMKKV
jgi:nucleoside-diphosphate-sugar epimerase